MLCVADVIAARIDRHIEENTDESGGWVDRDLVPWPPDPRGGQHAIFDFEDMLREIAWQLIRQTERTYGCDADDPYDEDGYLAALALVNLGVVNKRWHIVASSVLAANPHRIDFARVYRRALIRHLDDDDTRAFYLSRLQRYAPATGAAWSILYHPGLPYARTCRKVFSLARQQYAARYQAMLAAAQRMHRFHPKRLAWRRRHMPKDDEHFFDGRDPIASFLLYYTQFERVLDPADRLGWADLSQLDNHVILFDALNELADGALDGELHPRPIRRLLAKPRIDTHPMGTRARHRFDVDRIRTAPACDGDAPLHWLKRELHRMSVPTYVKAMAMYTNGDTPEVWRLRQAWEETYLDCLQVSGGDSLDQVTLARVLDFDTVWEDAGHVHPSGPGERALSVSRLLIAATRQAFPMRYFAAIVNANYHEVASLTEAVSFNGEIVIAAIRNRRDDVLTYWTELHLQMTRTDGRVRGATAALHVLAYELAAPPSSAMDDDVMTRCIRAMWPLINSVAPTPAMRHQSLQRAAWVSEGLRPFTFLSPALSRAFNTPWNPEPQVSEMLWGAERLPGLGTGPYDSRPIGRAQWAYQAAARIARPSRRSVVSVIEDLIQETGDAHVPMWAQIAAFCMPLERDRARQLMRMRVDPRAPAAHDPSYENVFVGHLNAAMKTSPYVNEAVAWDWLLTVPPGHSPRSHSLGMAFCTFRVDNPLVFMAQSPYMQSSRAAFGFRRFELFVTDSDAHHRYLTTGAPMHLYDDYEKLFVRANAIVALVRSGRSPDIANGQSEQYVSMSELRQLARSANNLALAIDTASTGPEGRRKRRRLVSRKNDS